MDQDNVHESIGASLLVARPVYDEGLQAVGGDELGSLGFNTLDLALDDTPVAACLRDLQSQQLSTVEDEVNKVRSTL